MARDANEAIGSGEWLEKPDDFQTQGIVIPSGIVVGTGNGQYYAHKQTYADGHTTIEWYVRGSGGAGNPDPVERHTDGPVNQKQKKEWDTAEEKPPTTRVINGVPHQVVGKDANGQDIWAPVQTQNGPATATKPAGAGTQRQEWRSEGTPDGQGGYDNSRPIMAEYVNGKRTGATRAPTAKELEDWNLAGQMTRNPGGKTDAEIKAEAAAAEAAKPKPVTKDTIINGQHYTTQTTPGVNGQPPKIEHFGPDGKPIAALPTEAGADTPTPITRGGKTYIQHSTKKPDGTSEVYYTDQNGARVTLPDEPSGALPEGAPQPSGRLGEAAADLKAFDDWLEPQVRSGKITAAQADTKREARRQFWATALSEQTGVVNAQRQGFADQSAQRTATLSDLSNRRTNETAIARDGAFAPDPTTLGAGGAAGLAQAIRNSRVDASNFVTLSGANRMVPEVQPGPALGSVLGMPLPGGVGPQMAPGFNPRPNAIGLGAIGAQPAPGGPAPLLPPPPPVAGPPPSPVNPMPGQPGNDPTAPVGLIQPSPYFLAGASRGHVHDPTSSVQAMLDDPRYDNEAVRQAVLAEYPGYPIDQLLQGRAA